MLSDISTEMLVKLRERYLNGRTCFSAFADGGDPPNDVAWIKERMIEAVENELRRRLN
jgi:hypothetical protein